MITWCSLYLTAVLMGCCWLEGEARGSCRAGMLSVVFLFTIYTGTGDYIVSYYVVFMVSLTIVSNLMMAGLTMAETCS
jgi:hypothetical protein